MVMLLIFVPLKPRLERRQCILQVLKLEGYEY